ncbi:MAG: hypothetical protein AAFX99_25520, partial [Myxococcota bacterium]
MAEPPTPAPLLRQVALGVSGLDFVEIHNPGIEAAELSDLYLATVPDYYRWVSGEYNGGSADRLVQFPEGAVLEAGASAVVVLRGTDATFQSVW